MMIILSFDKALLKSKRDYYWIIFMLNGISVAFFDFLTYPLVALGFSLICKVIINESQSGKSLLLSAREMVKDTFYWTYGYSGMWMGKWIIATVATGENVLVDGIESVSYRMVGDATLEGVNDISYYTVLAKVFKVVCQPPILFLLAGVIIIIICLGVWINRNFVGNESNPTKLSLILHSVSLMIFVALYPFVYYVVVQNHSAVHPWYAYRELAITVFAVGVIIINLQDYMAYYIKS